ncbi:hypothetical protein OEZ60_12735 [Defluviimonas sp. WL0024]|uniref:Uncharacterized protein n=1 Tax=Albidovulum salinarum TaxID=2984153 RepID=A0ABT2X5F1_9RHOB|nr:hypothetical protein [Defluviimonas sp. WL0024]MCU9848870.1 hypothetical protein [Defluviimonas sp. WL0024]
MKSAPYFHNFAASLLGLQVGHLWRGYGSAVFFELGRLTAQTKRDGSVGEPVGEVTLGVECSWRIEDRDSIVCGSWSEEEIWEPTFHRFRNSTVLNLEVFGSLPEVEMSVSASLRFLSFSTTEGQPNWFLIDRRNEVQRTYYVEKGKIRVSAE